MPKKHRHDGRERLRDRCHGQAERGRQHQQRRLSAEQAQKEDEEADYDRADADLPPEHAETPLQRRLRAFRALQQVGDAAKLARHSGCHDQAAGASIHDNRAFERHVAAVAEGRAASSSGATIFSAAKDSPVSAASPSLSSIASSSRRSAGTTLPASSSTTSPGTSAPAGTLLTAPSRKATACRGAGCFSADMARSARRAATGGLGKAVGAVESPAARDLLSAASPRAVSLPSCAATRSAGRV